MAEPGRPAIWTDPIAFEQKVDEYFASKDIDVKTWTGLARYLGFESRQSLEDYKSKPGFSYPIKKALLQIEEIYEKNLFSKNAAGPIFALKNFGWRDKQEVDMNARVEGTMTFNGIQIIRENEPKEIQTPPDSETGPVPDASI